MNFRINEESFNRFFRGFHFVGCAVRSRSVLYLLGRQLFDLEEGEEEPIEEDIVKRLLNILLDRGETPRYGYSDLDGFSIINVVASQVPKAQGIAVDLGGQVFAMGGGDNNMESEIPWEGPHEATRGGAIGLKAIAGQVYSVGGSRSVCRRDGPSQWTPLWNGLVVPEVKRRVELNQFGFEDIDGFAPDDLYAAGGDGDLWHYDGTTWKQVAFPTNRPVYNVCCGGDGYVYIGAHMGYLYRGRGNRWTEVEGGAGSSRLNGMVWHQDKLWCTSDSGLWTVENGRGQSADVPAWVRGCRGYISEGDGVLLLAGMYGAAFHDGKDWQLLVDLPDLYKKYGDS